MEEILHNRAGMLVLVARTLSLTVGGRGEFLSPLDLDFSLHAEAVCTS